MVLDKKLTFNHHLKEKISKENKGMGLITRLYPYLPRKTLVNIYKAFVRPHLDYGDIIYDNQSNDTFCQKIESVQHNAGLAITGAIRGTSREKLVRILLFGNEKFSSTSNNKIFSSVINFILHSKRFDGPLF